MHHTPPRFYVLVVKGIVVQNGTQYGGFSMLRLTV